VSDSTWGTGTTSDLSAHVTAEQRADALERVNQPRVRVGSFLWEWARSLTLAMFLFLFLHVFIMEAFKIPSGSMEGTLRVGDFLLVNKLVYGAELPLTGRRLPAMRAPGRGDVIVFKWPPDPSKNFVKRLVGLPGDTLAMNEGMLVRNGVKVEERYVSHTEPEADPSGDRQVALRRAGLLMGQQEFARAEEVYRSLLVRDPADEAARAGEKGARESLELLAMPEEYRRIPEAPRVTRADLAALVAVRVGALRRAGPGEPRVAVDIGGSWAREYIARVLALGIMEPYPNHTFQPGATVRRVDLARAASRTLDLLGFSRGEAPAPTDMSRSHLDFEAVDRALAAGLMGLSASGAFEPWRPVSGSEAIEVVDGVARIVGQ